MESENDRIARGVRAGIAAECIAFIYAGWGIGLKTEQVAIPAHCADASISLKKPELAGISKNGTEPTPAPPFERVFFRDGCILFDLSAYYLKTACESAACLPAPEVEELIAIPKNGCAADEEAWAYACARLIAALRSGRPARDTRAARDALLQCLMLGDEHGAKAPQMLAAAVRAALRACDEGSLGGEWADACARLLQAAVRDLKR